MGTSPITLGVGNGATLRLLLLLRTTAQGTAPPAQGQPPRARQADFVICDQAIENLFCRAKDYTRIVLRKDKTSRSYAGFVSLAFALINIQLCP
jgi:hypothetical protein